MQSYMWNMFNKTGNIEAYLFCNDYKNLIEENNNIKVKEKLENVVLQPINNATEGKYNEHL